MNEQHRLGILASDQGTPPPLSGIAPVSDCPPSEAPTRTADPEAPSGRLPRVPELVHNDGRTGARTGGPRHRMQLAADAFIARLRYPPGLATRHAVLLRQHLRQAIQDRLEHPEPQLAAALETADREGLERYRRALAHLPHGERELIVARVELVYSYEQIALASGWPSVRAARAAVKRALLHLAEVMARA